MCSQPGLAANRSIECLRQPCPAGILFSVQRSFSGALPDDMLRDRLADAPPPSVTMTGSTLLALRGTERMFIPGVAAFLGRAPCSVEALTTDAKWMLIRTPATASLCSSTSQDCGYQSLRVVIPNSTTFQQRQLSDTLVAPSTVNGAALSFPPFWGGLAAFPVPGPAPGSFVAAVDTSEPSPAVSILLRVPGFPSAGVYYARACNASGAQENRPDNELLARDVFSVYCIIMLCYANICRPLHRARQWRLHECNRSRFQVLCIRWRGAVRSMPIARALSWWLPHLASSGVLDPVGAF
jgi:hypothetical protein